MPDWVWIVIAIAALVLLGVIVWVVRARQRRGPLRERFGPEYDRAVSDRDSRRAAEAELERREEKRERLDIVPLSPESREEYLRSWRDVQAGFVDEPSQAVGEADRLVTEVMRERGYPMDEFDRISRWITRTSSSTIAPLMQSTCRTRTEERRRRSCAKRSSTTARSSRSSSRPEKARPRR